jgi:tetratricopeptide (TPR) repeat protein
MEADQNKQAELAAALYSKGRKLWTSGDKDDALNMFRKALAIQESVLGTYHKHTARTYYWVGFALKHNKEYDRALVAYRRTLRIRMSLFGEDDISTEDVHRALKEVLLEKDFDHDEIEEYFKAVANSVLHEKDGKLFAGKGDYDQAVEAYQKCLAIEESALGKFPLNVAEIHASIASAYKEQGEPDMAIVSYREALAVYESKLGIGHPHTIGCLAGIESSAYARGLDETAAQDYCNAAVDSISHIRKGDELQEASKYDKAIAEYKLAVEIEESALGPYPLTSAEIYRRIAITFRLAGKFDQSILAFRNALTIFIFECGSDHPTVIAALKDIGHTMKQRGLDHAAVNKYMNTVSYSVKYERYGEHICKEGDYNGAIVEFQKSMALEQSALGQYHLTQAALFRNIGDAYMGLGKDDRAIVNYRNAILIYQPNLGKSHEDTVTAILKIGFAAQEKGMADEEVEIYREGLQDSVEIEDNGDIFLKKGDLEKATVAFRRAITIEESSLGLFHLCTADLYSKIANILKESKDYDQALAKYRDVLAINQLSLGLDHPNSQNSQEDLKTVAKMKGMSLEDATDYSVKATNAISLEQSGDTLMRSQSYEQAIGEYGHAIEIEEASLGKSHLTTAAICTKIADVYRLKNQFNRAILVYRNAVRIHLSHNVPSHDDGGNTMHNLGLAVQGLGFSEASGLKYQKVVRDALQHENDGDAAQHMGNHDMAISEYRRAIAIEESILGKLHFTTTLLYRKIAEICRDQDDYESALVFYSKVLAIQEAYLGKDSADTLRTYNDLIIVSQRQAAISGAGLEGWTTLNYILMGLIGLLVLIATVAKSLANKRMPIKNLKIAAYDRDGDSVDSSSPRRRRDPTEVVTPTAGNNQGKQARLPKDVPESSQESRLEPPEDRNAAELVAAKIPDDEPLVWAEDDSESKMSADSSLLHAKRVFHAKRDLVGSKELVPEITRTDNGPDKGISSTEVTPSMISAAEELNEPKDKDEALGQKPEEDQPNSEAALLVSSSEKSLTGLSHQSAEEKSEHGTEPPFATTFWPDPRDTEQKPDKETSSARTDQDDKKTDEVGVDSFAKAKPVLHPSASHAPDVRTTKLGLHPPRSHAPDVKKSAPPARPTWLNSSDRMAEEKTQPGSRKSVAGKAYVPVKQGSSLRPAKPEAKADQQDGTELSFAQKLQTLQSRTKSACPPSPPSMFKS